MSPVVPYGKTNPKMGVNSEIKFILYNGRHWLAGGTNHTGGRLMFSNDSENWTVISSMDNLGGTGSSYEFGLWTGARWIVALMNVRKNYVYDYSTSRDGLTWEPFSPNNNPKALTNFPFIRDIAGTESLLVAVGMNIGHHNQKGMFNSTDRGKTWNITDDSSIFSPQYGGGLMSVKYNGSMFVAGGCGEASGRPAVIIYSRDGVKWTKANVPEMQWRVWNLASDGKAWIAGMQYEGILYSPDGINWQRTNFPKTDWGAGKLYSVNIYQNGLSWSKSLNHWFCSTTTDLYSSRDGMNWKIQHQGFGKGVVCVMADNI